MKTRLLQTWQCGLLALALPVISGCVADSDADTPKFTTQVTNVTPASEPSEAVADVVTEIPENALPPARPEPAPGSETRPLPAELKLAPGTAEIARLARAGLADPVMLAFVTNSAGTFNLGSEQIVYLNDLGVTSDVITAMIEHDRLLREGMGTLPPLATAAAPAAQAVPVDYAAMAAAAAPQALPAEAAGTEPPPPAATTETVPAPVTNVTYNYFYDSLSPYGTWLDVDGYGYVWQPSVVVADPGWRPYCHGGRWLYTTHGWYWHSDYSWGWAPFHYGRWFCHSRWGWCWRPDTIWGPAWVSWRYTDAYCGWAPLPPAASWVSGVGFTYYGSSVGWSFGFGLGWSSYAYVPWGRFHGHRPHHYYAPAHHARNIHRESTVVNNVIVGDNNTIINRGIGEERVHRYTKTELKPIRVREEGLAGRSGRLTPGDRLERGGRELVVRRPQLPQIPPAPVVARDNRGAPHGVTTASSGERRPNQVTRGTRTPTAPPSNVGGPTDGPPAARTAPGVASATHRDQRGNLFGRETAPRAAGVTPTRPATEVVAQPAPSPAAETRATPSIARSPAPAPAESPSSSRVTVIGRREAPPSATVSRSAPRGLETPARANTTYTWTQPQSRAANSINTPQRTPVFTQPTRPSPAPTPVAPPSVSRLETPRAQTSPLPTVRPEPRLPSPPVSSPSRSFMQRPQSPPTYTAPPARSAPSFRPAPAPPARAIAPPPRSSPAPSFAPAPAPSRPSAAPSRSFTPAPAPSAPRSAPAPPPSSSGSSGRSGIFDSRRGR